jgi:hypothetical protein
LGDLNEFGAGPGVSPLPWPLVTIDFEASGLGEHTYPIEVGIAQWGSPNQQIVVWSSLIRPTDDWLRHRQWHSSSKEIHGLTRKDLLEGSSPLEVLEQMNSFIGERPAFCDGGEHDLRWLRHLAQAAQVRPTFSLADWDALGGALDASQYARMIQWLDHQNVRHRAGDDAERLLKAIAIAIEPQTI